MRKGVEKEKVLKNPRKPRVITAKRIVEVTVHS